MPAGTQTFKQTIELNIDDKGSTSVFDKRLRELERALGNVHIKASAVGDGMAGSFNMAAMSAEHASDRVEQTMARMQKKWSQEDAPQQSRLSRALIGDSGSGSARAMRGGMLGAIAYKTMGEIQSGYASYLAPEVGMTKAAYSGDLFNVAQARIQREAGQSSAMIHTAAGVGGGIAHTAALYAATAGGLPGIGVAVVIEAVNMLAQAFATSKVNDIQKNAAKVSEAVNALGMAVSPRHQLLQAELGLAAYGWDSSPERNRGGFNRVTEKYGYNYQQQMEMIGQYARGGGQMLGGQNGDDIFGIQRAYNITPGQVAGFTKSFGAGGNLGASGDISSLKQVMGEAFGAGLDTARFPEFMSRVSSIQERLADRGVTIESGSLMGLLADLRGAGLGGFQGTAAAERMQGFTGGMMDQLSGFLMPQQVTQALAMRDVMSKGGGPSDWMGSIRDMMEHPEKQLGMINRMGSDLPDYLQDSIRYQTMGVMPGKLRGGAMADGMEPLQLDWEKGAASVMDSAAGQAEILSARMDNMRQLVVSEAKLLDLYDKMIPLVQKQLDNAMKAGYAALTDGVEQAVKTWAATGGGDVDLPTPRGAGVY